MGAYEDYDHFLDEENWETLKSSLETAIVTDLKSTITTEEETAMTQLEACWDGDDFDQYKTSVDATVTKCTTAIDSLWTETISPFIDQQLTDWQTAKEQRIAEIQEMVK